MSAQSELTVIVRAKDLCRYIMEVTQKSPKQYRFTFVSRLQNLALDVIEDIYLANELYLAGDGASENLRKRMQLQQEALTKTRLLGYIAQLALEQKAILGRQYEQIAAQSTDVLNLLGGWMRSDRKRFSGGKRMAGGTSS